MDDLVAFLRGRSSLTEIRINAAAVMVVFGETSPEALVGRKLLVPTEDGTLEYRFSEYLIQQDAFVVTRASNVDRPDLVAFLTARYDEDERTARAVEDNSDPWPGQWEFNGYGIKTHNGWSLAWPHRNDALFRPGFGEHVAMHDPARVLAEVEAKRRMVEEYAYWAAKVNAREDYPALADRFEVAMAMMRLLALPYADHPDYREEWKP